MSKLPTLSKWFRFKKWLKARPGHIKNFWYDNCRPWERIFYPESVRKELQSARGSLRYSKKKIFEHYQSAKAAEAIVASLLLRIPDAKPYCKIGSSYLHLEGAIIFANLTDMVDGLEIVEEIRQHGFKLSGEPEEYADNKSLTWYLYDNSGKQRRKIVFRGFFYSNQASCQYVQVGTKEVPVMELRCGDETGSAEGESDESRP